MIITCTALRIVVVYATVTRADSLEHLRVQLKHPVMETSGKELSKEGLESWTKMI